MSKRPPRVLIVDDDSVLLDALSQTLLLRFDGIKVDTCQTAANAIELNARRDYDSIISDIKMPGIDGLDLLGRLRQTSPEVPVLLITGHGETDLAIKALRAGAYDLVQKPIDRDYLIASLGRAIETRELRNEIKAKQGALERYTAELELRVQERTAELTRANQAKDEFLGLVSHEMKTPLAVIIGSAEILHKRGDVISDGDKQNLILSLREEGWRLRRIIENLLALGRAELGIPIATEPVNLTRLIEGQVTWHRKSFPQRTFNIDCPPELILDCEPTYLELVLSNLISNAEKYSESHEPIDVVVIPSPDEVRVSILDRGQGFPPAEADLLFKPFYRSEQAMETASGVGIGLAVCKRLLETQGGTICAALREGGGSEFSFYLPVGPALTVYAVDRIEQLAAEEVS